MRKIFGLFILALIVLLSGCFIPPEKVPVDYEVDINLEMKLNNEKRGIDFVISIDMNVDPSEVNNFRFVLYYKVNATTEDLDSNLQGIGSESHHLYELIDGKHVFTLENVALDYQADYISAFVNMTFDKSNLPYRYEIDSIVTTNLYTLALASEGDFADEIIDALNPNQEVPNIDVAIDVVLNNDNRGYDFNADLNSSDLLEALPVVYGFIYVLNADANLTLATSGVEKVTLDDISTVDLLSSFDYNFENVILDYSQDRIYTRAYVTISLSGITHTYYSDVIDFTLYELALASSGDFADEIIEEVEYQAPDDTEIKHVSMSVNTSNYTVIDQSENVTVTVTTDYLKVTVEITLEEGFSWSNSLTFKFNNKVISKSNYAIVDNKLVYQFDDPNWSGIY